MPVSNDSPAVICVSETDFNVPSTFAAEVADDQTINKGEPLRKLGLGPQKSEIQRCLYVFYLYFNI